MDLPSAPMDEFPFHNSVVQRGKNTEELFQDSAQYSPNATDSFDRIPFQQSEEVNDAISDYIPLEGLEYEHILSLQCPCMDESCSHNFDAEPPHDIKLDRHNDLSLVNGSDETVIMSPKASPNNEILALECPCDDEFCAHNSMIQGCNNRNEPEEGSCSTANVLRSSGDIPPVEVEDSDLLFLQCPCMDDTCSHNDQRGGYSNATPSGTCTNVTNIHVRPPKEFEEDLMLPLQCPCLDEHCSHNGLTQNDNNQSEGWITPSEERALDTSGYVPHNECEDDDAMLSLKSLSMDPDCASADIRNILNSLKKESNDSICNEIDNIFEDVVRRCVEEFDQNVDVRMKRQLSPPLEVWKYVLCKMKKYDRDPDKKGTQVEMLYL